MTQPHLPTPRRNTGDQPQPTGEVNNVLTEVPGSGNNTHPGAVRPAGCIPAQRHAGGDR